MNPLIEFTKWILKWISIVVGCLVVLGTVIGLGAWSWRWWTHHRHEAAIRIVVRNDGTTILDRVKRNIARMVEQNAPEADINGYLHAEGVTLEQVRSHNVGSPSVDSARCTGDHPIFVSFTNGSSRTVEYISIEISAHLPNHSTNILSWNSKATMDRVVHPKEGYGGCWKFPFSDEYTKNSETRNAVYEGHVWSVRFKD